MSKVLIAEDDAISRRLLSASLQRAGFEVIATESGVEAWERLCEVDAPRLAVLDWMMPGLDGTEVCRRLRRSQEMGYVYVILLTARDQQEDVVAGLQAGADDYLTKPFDQLELRSRVAAGERILGLQQALEGKVRELEEALSHVKQLQGLLPICMYCKRIRDEQSAWHRLETYIQQHSEASFTHSLCTDCFERHYPTLGKRKAD